MYVNHHSLLVFDTGAEVLPHHNMPVTAELNQEVFRFEILTQLTFSLSRLSIREAASSGFLSLTVTLRKHLKISPFLDLPHFSKPTNLSQASVQISTISLSCDATNILTSCRGERERDFYLSFVSNSRKSDQRIRIGRHRCNYNNGLI